jgi:hypothetical protein
MANGDKVYHTCMVMRHPAVARRAGVNRNAPAGPLLFMIQHTDKTSSCFSGPLRTFFQHAEEATPDLKEKRPLSGSRPDVIVMDHDTATLNGTCIALHNIRYYDNTVCGLQTCLMGGH